ncbi:hypothetical protein [Streptococcus mitis]|uniref:hypothetical protein n=1 Tax=Streptococcus mitis TaxID=28037 RepID=UPI00178CE58F|nr:hypothetical protein [Streptococcus mitis]
MGILTINSLIKDFENEFYPISDSKKALLEKQSLEVVLQVLSDMASWSTYGGKVVWK